MTKLFTLLFCLLTLSTLNAQVLLDEDFEGGAPATWTQQTTATDGGWNVGTAGSLSSAYFPIPDNGSNIAATNDDGCNCDKNADYFITPAIDLSSVAGAVLKFDMFYADGSYQGAQEVASVDVSIDGGTTWTVVETMPGNGDNWQNDYIIDVSAWAGNADVRFAFHYSDAGGWLYGWAIDNVSVYVQATNDVAVTGLDIPRFSLFGSDVTIQGEVTNYGVANLTSFDISWSDGVSTYTDQITGMDIPFLGTYNFTHSTTFPLPQAVTYNLTVWADNPNNAADGNPGNNQQEGVVSGVTYIPAKKMVAEEATGTWCGWCPRGTEWMDYMTQNYEDDFVGIAVHNGDPMTVADYDNGVGNFPGFSGYPSVIVDRHEIIDPSELESAMPSSLAKIAPVASDITSQLDVESRMFTSTATAEFVTQLDNLDYRMNIVLTEDGIHGSSNGFAQTNYYNGAGAPTDPIPGFGLDWDAAGDPVPAAEMWYNHVGVQLSDGWAGEAGSIPAAVNAGDMVTKDYSIPNFDSKGWNPFNMHAIVLVLDNASGEVLNAKSVPIDVICPADLGLTIDVTDATTNGTTDGTVAVTEPGTTPGFPPYSYEWSNGETTPGLTDVPSGDYSLTVSDKIGCTQTFDVTVGAVTGVSEIETLTGISLTPNPASTLSVLDVQFSKAVDMRLDVVNVAGKVMYATAVNNTLGGQYNLDLASYPDGIYFVKISVGEQANVKRLMVSK